MKYDFEQLGSRQVLANSSDSRSISGHLCASGSLKPSDFKKFEKYLNSEDEIAPKITSHQ